MERARFISRDDTSSIDPEGVKGRASLSTPYRVSQLFPGKRRGTRIIVSSYAAARQ